MKAMPNDTPANLEVIWDALQAVRETMLPEGIDEYDRQWENICEAMAWITEDLGYSGYDENGDLMLADNQINESNWDRD